MTTIEQPRLEFHTDLTEAEQVYDFPKTFARFLVSEGYESDASEFLDAVNHYLRHTDSHEAALATILNIGSYYAEIVDHSGVPFEMNELFFSDGTPMTAEEVLESLEAEADQPDPGEVEPLHPDLVVLMSKKERLEHTVYDVIVALRHNRHMKDADQLAREVRDLVRTEPSIFDVYLLLEQYVTLDWE